MKRMFFLLIVISVCTSFLVSCHQKLDFATEEPFVIVTMSYGGENTIEHFYPSNVSIDIDGNVKLYSNSYSEVKISEDAPTIETTISESEVKDVQESIEAYDFWSQEEDISDNNSNDGTVTRVTVQLTNDSKSVGGYNPLDEDFNELAGDIFYGYIDAHQHKKWEKKIKQHIIEMNPEIETNP